MMEPSVKMLKAWFDETHAELVESDPDFAKILYAEFLAGAAADAHLRSSASEEWRKKHNFINN